MSAMKEEFTLPNSQPVVALECKTAFDGLTSKEKLYAHYMSIASWVGSLIVLVQTSPESPVIFTLLHKVFSEESIDELKVKALKQLSDEDFHAILVYTSGFFANAGNYKGFGDTKFIPNLPEEKFEFLIRESRAFEKSPNEVTALWEQCKRGMYSINDNIKSLGFPWKGLTTYFSSNYSTDDVKLLGDLMKRYQIEANNTRTIKLESNNEIRYQVVLASVENGVALSEKHDNYFFEIVKGDYSGLLACVNENLLKAKEYASTDLEKQMIDRYVDSFKTGSLDEHKNGSRFWIKNKNPVVETYIGFISRYRDPHGSRGEFKGYVAIVNKETSKKFAALVDRAEQLLPRLPWPKDFEKDKFLRPDFSSLDVLTFASSSIPCGIANPVYDEIVQNEGFKNVSLENVIPCGFKNWAFAFLSPEDRELIIKHAAAAFEIQVGLHELLGHGSGKMFHRAADGVFDFDKNSVIDPLTKQPISSWYEPGDTYDSIFTALGAALDECRAECVGLYLSLVPEVVRIFVDREEDVDDIAYANWLLLLVNGVERALEMYQPKTESWLQAHSQARFVIARVLLEAGDELLKVTEVVPNEKLLITLNRSKLQTKGAEAIKNFMLKLQVYQSTANVAEAKKLFDRYSKVSDEGTHPWLRWRNIVLKHRQPKQIFVQSNTSLKSDNVELKTYEPTLEGFIKSWVERLPHREHLYSVLLQLAEKDRQHFQY